MHSSHLNAQTKAGGDWYDQGEKITKKASLEHQYDHELANEPLTEAQRQNNKKTKKRH
ncbi:small acid-soluble spore protein O [Pullulanibacillus camelliae]|uniref:small acid-soluble spore protein O n=1 Tax=Pullulanibacillus camelliae TaxID=1707096 RepID=UPI0027E412BE|nr:small acid-soluble spore protein O [Pullulanibacillus camelliae]